MNITKPLDHTINAYPFVNRAGYILFHIQKGDSKPFVNSRLEFQACSVINNFSNFTFFDVFFLLFPDVLCFTHANTHIQKHVLLNLADKFKNIIKS